MKPETLLRTVPATDETPVAPEHLVLAADFPERTREQWRSLVAGVLRKSGLAQGSDPEEALSVDTEDHLRLRPLYTSSDAPDTPVGLPGSAPFVRGTTAARSSWDVRQRYTEPDPAATNQAVLADLANGGTSVWLVLGDRGVASAALDRALQDVFLDVAPIVLQAGPETLRAAEELLALATRNGVAHSDLRGSLGADPIADRARTGNAIDLGALAAVAELAAGTGMRGITVDGTVYHNTGGGDADELAAAAAAGVAYLRALERAGVADPFDQLEFRYAVSADQFGSIAKLRAARRIWSRIADLSGTSAGQRQHAVTSQAMMTRRDPWVNVLRTTVACFAAAIGGAEAITVTPFDSALGLPDQFARRIARNTQSILLEESHVARVMDPAGGSWYLESLTEQLAEAAWAKFTSLERAGGAIAAMESGLTGQLITETRSTRAQRIATRAHPVTGVSRYPLLTEDPIIRATAPADPTGGLLPSIRYAAPFEELRDRSDAHLKATGARPQVQLYIVGGPAAPSVEVGFATELFQAGGIDVVVTAEPGPGAKVVCLCVSRSVEDEVVQSAVARWSAEGAAQLWVTGGPRDGVLVDGWLQSGGDALKVLESTLTGLGVL